MVSALQYLLQNKKHLPHSCTCPLFRKGNSYELHCQAKCEIFIVPSDGYFCQTPLPQEPNRFLCFLNSICRQLLEPNQSSPASHPHLFPEMRTVAMLWSVRVRSARLLQTQHCNGKSIKCGTIYNTTASFLILSAFSSCMVLTPSPLLPMVLTYTFVQWDS